MMHLTDNEEALLDYLYEEGDPAERLKVARHLQDCAACSVAVLELQSVRGLLSEWTPPQPTLGFRIVQDAPPAPLENVQRGWRFGAGWPVWAQAAAALVVFGAGMGVSQLRFEFGDGALTVRSRSGQPSSVVSTSMLPGMNIGHDITLPPTPVSAIEASNTSAAGPSDSASANDVLRRVKALIDESESRQQRELALRLADVVRDFDTQRQADMLRVDENFGQLEGQTGVEVARQRELLNSLVKVSQGVGK